MESPENPSASRVERMACDLLKAEEQAEILRAQQRANLACVAYMQALLAHQRGSVYADYPQLNVRDLLGSEAEGTLARDLIAQYIHLTKAEPL
jgi:hypothetical protein